MDNTAKNELKATGQVGLANASIDDVNLSFSPTLSLSLNSLDRQPLPQRLLMACRPDKWAQMNATATEAKAAAISNAVKIYRETFPTFNDNQLFLAASGYYATPEQANNAMNVLERAADKTTADKTDELPIASIDSDIRGAQSAYEEKLRDIWSTLVAQEVSTGHAKSKRTKMILENMDGEDALQLHALLKFCLWAPVGPKRTLTPVPVLVKTPSDNSWTYNDGAIAAEALNTLESFGLITTQEWITFSLPKDQGMGLGSHSHTALYVNNTTDKLEFNFGQCKFLKPGIELAEVIAAETDERTFKLLKQEKGLNLIWERKPMIEMPG